jgi:o-succinylbenzoate---CoA ligase
MALSVFAAAAEAPDRAALVRADGGVMSYAALARGTREAVGWLRQRDLDRAPLLALDAGAQPAVLEMLHALIALGVPVLLLHPGLTAGEAQTLLAEARPAARIHASWRETGGRAVLGADPVPIPDDERTLAIVHTSGTTGRPRGVILPRRAFVASAAGSAANLGWRDDDRWLLRLPVAHVGGLSIVTRCLLARRTVVLAPDADVHALLATLARERVTILSLVPTLLARILDLSPPPPPPAALRAVLLGGAAASAALLERAADLGWPVLTTYGMTEACSQVTTQAYGTVNRGDLGAGRPLDAMEVRIDDTRQILVRGPGLMTGYLIDGGVHRPFLEGGWLPTGDHGHLDQAGNLHVAGRREDRIVTGGENVDPIEVQRALERVPGVLDVCVFGKPDDEWGEVVCAAVVAGPDLELDRLRARIRDDLAPFKRPRQIALVERIPVGRSGKVDRATVAGLAGPALFPL